MIIQNLLLWPVNLLAYKIEECLVLWIGYSCKIPPEFPKFPVNSNLLIVWIIYNVCAKKLWILRLMDGLHKCTHNTYFWNIVNKVCHLNSHGFGLCPYKWPRALGPFAATISSLHCIYNNVTTQCTQSNLYIICILLLFVCICRWGDEVSC